jgi:hypothetical protein
MGDIGVVGGGNEDFLFGLVQQCGHENFCTLGARNSRAESSRFSINVARCTNVSAVSQIISLIASFGSIRKRCCNILKNGISWGVSAT